MSSKNGSSLLNGTKMSVPFSDNVPLSSLDKVIPLFVVLGVLFLVFLIGKPFVQYLRPSKIQLINKDT